MNVKEINSAKARRSFADLLNETGLGGHRTIITRKGKPVAAMVPLEDLKAIEQAEDNKDITEARRILFDPDSRFIPWEEAEKKLWDQ